MPSRDFGGYVFFIGNLTEDSDSSTELVYTYTINAAVAVMRLQSYYINPLYII
jgi:hypothetical protein